MKYILETIAFNIESCKIAQAAGAHRIELCDNPGEGGTTPSYGLLKAARQAVIIDLFPIIRPRGGDFFYSDDEFDIMKTDIKVCKDVGCDGVVFGILNGDATIDTKRCKILVQLAYPMSVTFHRAFDRVINPTQALEDVIECGFERILTSGFYPAAQEGKENLKKLIELAQERIIIMPGSGIRAQNVLEIAQHTGAVEFHTSARKTFDTNMNVFNNSMNENLQYVGVDEDEGKSLLHALTSIL